MARAKATRGNAIRIVIGGEVRTVRDTDPNTTVLNWLRLEERRAGTKEGCAEGDCGTCTVVLGTLDGDRVRYRAFNACILFLPMLDGKELITVEDLAERDGTLHPVQQAMVDCHGSQCGFCTPGFVMSLFALYHGDIEPGPAPNRDVIDDALAGNLCRCTGYRSIIAAAEAMGGYGRRDRFSRGEKKTVALLRSIRRTRMLELAWNGRKYFAPRNLDQLADCLKAHPDAHILAGGTDLGLVVTKALGDLETLVYTGSVRGLDAVKVSRETLSIGAAASYTDALAALAADYPDFGEVLRRLGSVQIRNAGTIGGNIGNASPIGDTPPLLLALDARLVLRRGKRTRELPLDDFFTGYRRTCLRPGEFIERILVQRPRKDTHFRAYKISKRFDQDISAVCGAMSLTIADGRVLDARIAFGGMAATPQRARAAEAALVGAEWTLASVYAAMAALDRDFAPLTDMRASSGYRMQVARNLIEKAYIEITGGVAETRVVAYGR